MLVLALESATELAGVALADESGVVASATIWRGRHHAEFVAPAIEFLLERVNGSLRDLDGLCVDTGPGLFTGLRVGVATAKALAFALSIPVATASSLEVLALAHAEAGAQSTELVVPVVDARRGEVFTSRFRAGGGKGRAEIARVGDDVVVDPRELARSLSEVKEPVILTGDGAQRYFEEFASLSRARLAGPSFAHPRIDLLATLGVERLARGQSVEADALVPTYLREADVRINWDKRLPPRESSKAPVS